MCGAAGAAGQGGWDVNLQIEGAVSDSEGCGYSVSVKIIDVPDAKAEAMCDAAGRMIARTLADMGAPYVEPVTH